MKENKRALIVIGILVLCCIACILYLFVNRVHMPNVSYMSIKQADLTDTEREMFSLFDSGTTDLFDFRVNTSDINNVVYAFESLENGKWNKISSITDKVYSSYNRLVIDFDYVNGGRISHASLLENGEYSVFHSSMAFPNNFNVMKVDSSNDVIVSAPFDIEAKIVKDKPIILQLYYIGDVDEELNDDFFNNYEHPEKFADYKSILVVTATFTKK